MQLIEYPIDHVAPILSTAIHQGINVHLSGGSGVGKSVSVDTAATLAGRKLCVKIFSTMDVPDVGMATPSSDERFLRYRVNEGFPFVGTEHIWANASGDGPVLFLDELPDASPYMHKVIQQAALTKSIHGVPFIKNTVIFSAGNRAEHAAQVNRMSGPMSNRFIHINVLPPTLDGFVAFCRRNNVNEWVSSYAIHTGGESIYEFDQKKFLLEPAFATPRGWCEGVSKVLDYNPPDDIRIGMIAGQVGRARGEDFETFYRIRSSMPDMEKIKATGEGPVPTNVSTKIIVINSLVRHADHKCIGNLFKYVSKVSATDPEFNELFERALFTKDRTYAGHPEYTKWVLLNNRKPLTNSANTSPTAATPTVPQQPTPITPITPITIANPRRRI
jgi:hypothetical protein